MSRQQRCTFVGADGRRCRQRRWRGKQVCYQHDPEAAGLRAHAGRPRTQLMTVKDVQELVAEALGDLRAGRIRPGEAYAVGYLAQLALAALGAAGRESKLDVKHFWEMVDLGAALERAVEMQKERQKEEKEAEEAEEAEETEETDPSTRPSGLLRAKEADASPPEADAPKAQTALGVKEAKEAEETY